MGVLRFLSLLFFFFFNWVGSCVGCYGLGCFCFHDLGRVNKMVKKNKVGWVLLVKGLLIIFRWLGYGYSKQRVGLRVTFVQVGGVRDGG